ncbi:hypothetical protein DXG01_004313 [Tephrocybe rancida]|nr:hypothetical protein DXG01_004313 [Tephrocybe rancida]
MGSLPNSTGEDNRTRYKSYNQGLWESKYQLNRLYGFKLQHSPPTAMKFFSITALTALAASALIGTVIATPAPAVAQWLHVESGINDAGNTTGIERRAGAEVVTCYNQGTKADRAPIISVIDDFCNNRAIGRDVANGQTIWSRYQYGTISILVSGAAINGYALWRTNSQPISDEKNTIPHISCNFKVDNNCNRLLRLPVDKCNTGGENGKQGGYVTDLCGQWRTDPGSGGSDN